MVVIDLPNVDLGPDTAICAGESFTFNAGNPGYTFNWDSGEISQSIEVQNEGLYGVVLTDKFGCSGSDSVSLSLDTVNNPFSQTQQNFCEGDTVSIYPNAYDVDDQFYWLIGGQLISGDTLKVWYEGTYEAVVQSYHCRDTFYYNTIQLDTPHVEITILDGNAPYCFDYQTALLGVVGQGSSLLNVYWTQQAEWASSIEVNQPGVQQALVDDGNCSSQIEIELKEYCAPLLFIPNAFTPNGDGTNDVWLPVASYTEEYLLLIFDRWGKVIFETSDPSTGWAGNSLEGRPLPIGVYVYKLDYSYDSAFGGAGKNQRLGRVTLVR